MSSCRPGTGSHPDRRRNPAAEELSADVPQQHAGLHRLRPPRRLDEHHTAAEVLTKMDRYYCGHRPRSHWVATQLIRRLADPRPADDPDEPDSDRRDWSTVRRRCLSVAVAMPRRRGDGGGTADTPGCRRPTGRILADVGDPRRTGQRRPVVWQRIVAAIKRDPYGRTARQVEEVLDTEQPLRCLGGADRGPGQGTPASGVHRTRRGDPPCQLLERSGRRTLDSPPASGCPWRNSWSSPMRRRHRRRR